MLIAIVIMLALILLVFAFILIGVMLNHKDGQKETEEISRILVEYLENIQRRFESIYKIEDQNGHLLLLIRDLLDSEKEKRTTEKKDDIK